MPNLNIHWKGYPHRHLPRIRVASTGTASVRSRSIPPRVVAVDNIRLQQKRKKQSFAFRRRRGRGSHNSASAALARKHNSLRARQHMQVFGCNPDIASKANTIKTKSAESSVKAPDRPPPAAPTVPKDILSHTTVIDSTDGAGCSSFRKSIQPENLYSLMHVAEVPVYWSSNKPSNRKKPSLTSSRALSRNTKGAGEYAHAGPLDSLRRRRSYHTTRRVIGKTRTYDSRIDPRILLDRERPTKSFPADPAAATRHTTSRPPPNKSWQGNPELRRILSSKLSKSKAGSQSVTPSMKSVVQSLLSDPASRTPSQRRAIKRFTTELELYLQAAKSLPKQTLAPSPSATTISAHTIEALKPYQTQLRSAGLAVTAADQLRESSIMAKLQKSPSPPPTPPKDSRYVKKSVAAKSKIDSVEAEPHHHHQHHHRIGSVTSFVTDITVMDFTLPYERSGPPDPKPRPRSSVSSDNTIMAFTPPHEKPPPQPASAPPPPPRALALKSLPWLRKQDPVKVSSWPSPKDKGVATAITLKAKTRNPSDVLLSFSPARNSAIEKTMDRSKDKTTREIEPRKHEVRRRERNSRIEADPANAADKHRLYIDAAIQTTSELSDDHPLDDQGVQYVNATTQIYFTDVGQSTASKQGSVERRTPLIQAKNMTLPIRLRKCAGDCSQPAPRVSGVQSPRYKDQAVQTELVERSSIIKQAKTAESERASFKTNAESPDLNRTFPFPSPSPFHHSPGAGTPQKSGDDVAVRRRGPEIMPSETKPPSPQELPASRPTPWPLRCTQCSAEINQPILEPEAESLIESEPVSQPESEPELEPNRELVVRPQASTKWNHTCTARSSLECQQCAPEASAPASPQEELPESSFRPPQPPSRQSTVRTTHWAANLEAELEGIIQGYHSPEERFMPRQVTRETIDEYAKQRPLADPVKKPPQPRLRLRPPPTTRTVPKQERVKPAAPIPAAPLFAYTIPSKSGITSPTLTRDSCGISDRSVFRGLHVATAAACDEDVAKWIDEITGTGIRRFLADLSAFYGLGLNTLVRVARRAAKQRRGEVRAWERVREQRLRDRDLDDGWEDCAVEDETGVCKDRKTDLVAGEETVDFRVERSTRERCGEEVIGDVIAAREHRSRKELRERAIRMAWRGRSVSDAD